VTAHFHENLIVRSRAEERPDDDSKNRLLIKKKKKRGVPYFFMEGEIHVLKRFAKGIKG
jgi:hypothetical protein